MPAANVGGGVAWLGLSARLPASLRFYHTHNRAGANLSAGQYSGEVGPVYIEPKHEPGNYDREIFLTLKEFEPTFSRGGDMAMNFLLPATRVKALEEQGESAMKASLAKGMPKGYEVGYRSFTINGRMLGHGEPIRVKQGERIVFHILNGSATEIRSLALPSHFFHVVALDGNPVPTPTAVPVLWLGTAEQWIKEGKQAVKMTRLSCHRFRSNQVRLALSLLAYNLGNLWWRLGLPRGIENWSLTSLQQRLVKTGGRLVKHARYYRLLLAEGHLNRRRFGAMLDRISLLPVPTG